MNPELEYVFSDKVRLARDQGTPIVALESTIITHGMPWPQNVETARSVEAMVRAQGAEPATIAVIEGQLCIGLDDEQLDRLGQTQKCMKLSRADFAFAISQGRTGSTTVAATMIAAEMAGISVFATGGIGGVHRGAEIDFDISADLNELSRTSVLVVCAGAKAILDIEKTLEVLETNGVPVISYQSDNLPAFWSCDSGIPSPLRLESAAEIARHQITRHKIGLQGGTLVANPVPLDRQIDRGEMENHIKNALADAKQQGVTGKNVTPFLLGRIFELTNGKSLKTNIALILNNAQLAAQIACALAAQE